MKVAALALSLMAFTSMLPAQAQETIGRPQVIRPLILSAPGSNVTFDGIGTNLPLGSMSFSARNTVSNLGSGAGAGKVNLSELTLVRKADEATTELFTYCATGKHMKTVTVKAGGFTITLNDVIVSGQQLATDENGALVETLTLIYTQIKIVTPANKTAGWDIKANRNL